MNEKAVPYIKTFYLYDLKSFGGFPAGYNRRDVIIDFVLRDISSYYDAYDGIFSDEIHAIAFDIFEDLVKAKALRKIEDEFAGEYYQYIAGNFDNFKTASQNNQIAGRYKTLGPVFMTDVLTNILKDNPNKSDKTIPASDRIVRLNHNDPKLKSLVEEADNFAESMKTANDIGNLTADEQSVATYESFQLADLLRQDFVRIEDIKDRSKTLLKWIGKEAGSAIIGAAALGLLALIATFFGFQI